MLHQSTISRDDKKDNLSQEEAHMELQHMLSPLLLHAVAPSIEVT